MQMVVNPFIVNLQYCFMTDYNIYMVTEFMPGGDLYNNLMKINKFSEDMVKIYIACIVQGV